MHTCATEIEHRYPWDGELFIPRARACIRVARRALTVPKAHSACQTRPARPRHALTRSRMSARCGAFQARHPDRLARALAPRVLGVRTRDHKPRQGGFSARASMCGGAAGELGRRSDACASIASAHVGQAAERPYMAGRVGCESGQWVLMYCRHALISISDHWTPLCSVREAPVSQDTLMSGLGLLYM